MNDFALDRATGVQSSLEYSFLLDGPVLASGRPAGDAERREEHQVWCMNFQPDGIPGSESNAGISIRRIDFHSHGHDTGETFMSADPIKINLLLVEDDPSLQEGVRDLLEIADFEYEIIVLTADDGVSALEIMRTVEPDIIVSDIMMPRMGGFELLSEVRRNPDWVHVPFIFVTAKGKKQDILEGRLSGAEMYITKPFDSAELIDMIKIQLDRSLQKRAVRRTQMEGLKRSILQVLNHEFRTPLTYVTAYYEMLASSVSAYQDTDNMGEYLRGIRGGCERMSDLVEDLIQVMDIRSGETFRRFKEKAAPIEDLAEIIRKAGQQMASLARSRGVDVHLNVPEKLPAVWGLRQELFTAVRHVIENGIKFSHKKLTQRDPGQVKVRAAATDHEITIVVEDNGIGVPAHAQSEIFDLFVQYNRDKYEQQGSGAGLPIVKGILEAHGGNIEIESDGESGLTAVLTVPLAANLDPVAVSQGFNGIHYQKQKAHILLVEDDPSVLQSLCELLSIYDGPYDLSLATAADGQLGLREIDREKPDLIISDVMMPNMDGYEFVKIIRQTPALVHIPIIFLSARNERHEIMRGRRVGAEEYVTKPYDTDEVLSLITAMLNRHFQLQNVVDSDFERFKISILSMLRPDFLGSIASVNDYSTLISNGVADVTTSKELRDALRGIQVGSQRISELVDDFITLAEIKTGETETAFRNRAHGTGNLTAIIREFAQKITLDREGSDCDIHYLEGDQERFVIIDYDGLERAFKRLFGVVELNCIKGDGRTIYVETEESGDQFRVQLWHDGRPLDPEAAAVIEKSLDDEGEITGLEVEYGPRLRIARSIVEIHGGTLEFIHGRPGDGSLTADTLHITLPTVETIPDNVPGFDLTDLRLKFF